MVDRAESWDLLAMEDLGLIWGERGEFFRTRSCLLLDRSR